jgi:capsular polysaccharide biosynthesis protein
MDFKKLYLVIKKNFKFLLIFTGIVIILVEAFFAWQSRGYSVSLALSVFSKVSQPSQGYQFDDYLSVKAADAYSDTVSQWVASPEVINSVYQKAAVAPTKSLLGQPLKAQKMAANYVSVEFLVSEQGDGKKIADALISTLQAKTEQANKYSGNAVFTIIGGEPVVSANQANFILDGLIALISGAILGIFITLLKEDDSWN